MSGGGGYGKKQGLLSLDPQTSFHAGEGFPSSASEENAEQQEIDLLSCVAEPGDLIQFFIVPSYAEAREVSPYHHRDRHGEIRFGTVPPPKELSSDPITEPATGSGGDKTEYRHGIFGVLSEQGLGVTMDTHCSGVKQYAGVDRVGRVVQTKLDMPFLTYRFLINNLPFEVSPLPKMCRKLFN